MKGILFKPEMIKAIMDGKKTQTRRIIKSKHESGLFQVCKRKIDGQVTEITSLDWNERPKNDCTGDVRPKYKVGEVIYVKEPYEDYMGAYNYKLGKYGLLGENWKNSMFMPASAARTFLKITNVRVEKLGDITAGDIEKEGVGVTLEEWTQGTDPFNTDAPNGWPEHQFDSWETLWLKINKSYDPDQWLFVYEFQVVDNPKL